MTAGQSRDRKPTDTGRKFIEVELTQDADALSVKILAEF
jgi:hypothetical protein